MLNLDQKTRPGPRRGLLRFPAWILVATLFAIAPPLARAEAEHLGRHMNFGAKELFDAGGVVGIVLMALSVATVALCFEHLLTLRRGAIVPRKLAEQVHALIQQRQIKRAADECRESRSLLGFVLAAGFGEVGTSYSIIEKAMEDACAQHAARLYRKIDYLSVIATISPMLGLLGTVWGMMQAFSEFASKANVQVSELAPGISTALVTTLFGLMVAIPAYAASAYFRIRVDESVAACAQIAGHLFNGYRRVQDARRRKSRAGQVPHAPVASRPPFPSVAIEREKSA